MSSCLGDGGAKAQREQGLPLSPSEGQSQLSPGPGLCILAEASPFPALSYKETLTSCWGQPGPSGSSHMYVPAQPRAVPNPSLQPRPGSSRATGHHSWRSVPAQSRNMTSGLGRGLWSLPERRVVRFCPACRGEVKPTFHFCPFCGDLLPDKDAPGDGSSPEEHGTAGKVPQKREAHRDQGVQGKKRKWPQPFTWPPSSTAISQEAAEEEAPSCFLGKAGGQDPHQRQKPVKPLSPESLGTSTVLMDKDGRRWRLGALVRSSQNGMLFEAVSASETTLLKQRFSLKLDLKSGRLFHEQNFFQRAVKEKEVNKWKKSHFVPFLAIPACISFGLHHDTHRFLVFPDLGRSLQSILDDRPNNVLTEKTVFHLLFRLVDALEFIHENEYVHGNISAENIFVNPDTLGQVTLAGYSFVFRYCPGGKHVAYVEQKRATHQGPLEFISLDLHKGVDPSRRSDMQALGYCLLKWLYGALPWTGQLPDAQAVMRQKERFLNNIAELMRQSCGQRRPPALEAYLNTAMALQYAEKPNYRMLQTVLMSALENHHVKPYDSISF
ncbi:serine/threonine-protein kinase VRK3 isoform X2 [Phascolarctos cinereus]|uniref:Inactive serine/threonine-protein kinase VRK3 isoform X2 n=1 Tax=Phascolarctos cinereus TaxID=38626 RepID=A0A6P5LQW2_PHACI|nr:inactive serine/threonine-protein kinase VRK3 isoform X2 [Phascolarctos cinereus]